MSEVWAAAAAGVATAAIGAGANYLTSSGGSGGSGYQTPDYQTPDYSGAIDYLKGNGFTDYSQSLGYLNNGTTGAANFAPAIQYTQENWVAPQYQEYTPTNYSQGLQDYLGQGKYAPKIFRQNQAVTNRDNRAYLQDIQKFAPQAAGNSRLLSRNVQSMLRGDIPQSDYAQIQNSTAEQALSGGFSGSQAARNLTARDLGLTSLQLQQQGAAMLPGSIAASASLSPFQASTLNSLFTPQQLLSQATSENRQQNQVFNANATNTAQFKNQATTAITNLLAQGAISQAEKERLIAGIMGKSAESRTQAAYQIAQLMANQAQADAGIFNQQADVNATGANTNALAQQQQQNQLWNGIIGGASQGIGAGLSAYGGSLFGPQAGTSPYSGTYQGMYNNQPVYRPQGY